MLRYKVDITLDQDDLEITLSSSCFTIDDSTLDEGFFYVIPKDDCTEKTFTVVIKCGDTTFTNTYKICTDYQDCTSCEVCTDGLCLEKCEQHCNEGDCVECTSNTHCANNLICVQGNCVCPGNLKLDGEGKCVECLADDECSACAKCIEGGCVSTICPPFLNSEGCLVESLCFNNNCVQCINNSTCEANEVCTDFTCICAPGYVRSLITGLCEPIPLCVDDECPACYSCNSGNCVPIICPEGYICVNGDCVQPCTDGDCTGNKVCNSELGIPVCIECQGGCDNQTDCAEGCSCVNGVCIKAPDNPDPCTSYLDCPPNHGCLNGICYPCEELSLTDCEVAEGCQPNGDECNPDNPCSGACNESTDCGDGCICIDSVCTPNYGCTDTPCLNYSQCAEGCGCEEELCIPCNSVSCNSTIDCPDGCYCLNGTCTSGDDPDGPNPEPEFPCDSVLCQNSTECGPDCICIEGRCYPCNSFNCATCPDPCICETLTCEGPDTVRCNDILTLTKGDCELEANLVSTDCCGCENFNVFTYLTSISNTGFTLNSQLKQNTLNLSQLLIDNAFPAIGTLRYTITTSFVRLNTQMLPTGIIGTQVDYLNQSFNNIEFKSDNLIIQKPGNIFTVNGFTVQALSVTIEVQTQTNFHFPNQCIFTLPKTTIAVFTGSFNVVNKTTNLNSLTTCRLPLLTLFKGNHATAINTKIYAKYTNSFTRQHPDIEAYKYYKLVSDCSCIPDTFYSCTDGEANKLTFCLKNRPDIEFSNCNKKLKFVTPLIQDCIIMRNALYELVVNGVVVQTFNVQPDNTIIPMSYIYNSATTITLVEIRLVNDECEECIFTYTPPPSTITPTFEVETDICSDTNYQTFYIGANDSFQLFYHTTLEGTRTVVAVGNGITNSSVMANNGFYTLRILVDGCYAEITREITFNFIYPFADLVPLCNPTRLQITTTEPVNVFIPGISYSGSVNGTITVPAVDGTFTVISSIGTCTYIQEVTIECCNPNPISGVAVSYSCPNGVILPTIIGQTLTFTIAGEALLQGDILTPGTYTIIASNGECTKTLSLVVPQCYVCSGLACLSAPGNVGPYNNSLCNGACALTPDPNIDIVYLCETGFDYIAYEGVSFSLNGNPLDVGSIINAGSYTVNVTTPSGGFTLPLVVPQCKVCDPTCLVEFEDPEFACDRVASALIYLDAGSSIVAAENVLSLDVFDIGGVWVGNIYVSGNNLVPSPITIVDTTAPIAGNFEIDDCTCINPNCALETLVYTGLNNAVNSIAPFPFVMENTDCNKIYRITFPTCQSWYVEFANDATDIFNIGAFGWDAVTETFFNFNPLDRDAPNGGLLFLGEGDDYTTSIPEFEITPELICCVDAVPNIGLLTCPETCISPEPPPSCDLIFRLPNGLVLGTDSEDVYAVDLLDAISGEVNHLDTTAENLWSEVDHTTYETDLGTDLTTEGFTYDSITVSVTDNPILTITGTDFNLGYWEGTEDNTLNIAKSLPYTSCPRVGCIGFTYPPEGTEDNFLEYLYAYSSTLINQSAPLTGLDFSLEADRNTLKSLIEALVSSVGETYEEVIVEWDGSTLSFAVKGSQVGLILYGLGHSISYDCPVPEAEECICLSATIIGRSVFGLETNDGTQLLEEDGFSSSYTLSNTTQRNSLTAALQAYYDDIDLFPCTPEVEIIYDGFTEPGSSSTITLNCIPPDHPKALKLWQNGPEVYTPFIETEDCVCEITSICDTQEVFVISTISQGDDCVNETIKVQFSGTIVAVSALDFPVGLTLNTTTEDTPDLWDVIFNETLLTGSYTISFEDERGCIYYHTFNINCAGCIDCEYSLYGTGRVQSLVIGGVPYNIGASVTVACPSGTPVFSPSQAGFEDAIRALLVNQGDCGTITFNYSCEDGEDYDTNNCQGDNISAPYNKWVKIEIIGSGLDIDGIVWNNPGCQVPVFNDYCCQQDGCNIQYLYGTGKLIGMTVGATVYDLDAALDPNDAVAICYEPEFPNFITYIREALDYIHTEEAASLEYCIVVECFPYDPLLDPADCLLGDTDNQERFVRISVINSTLTLEDPTWIKSGAVLSCNYPSVNGC